ncbi:uncharacterized protein LOC132644534 [Lycium barbarum]|uniref:uncharacterized protein LOC132644534 n=1 Tax=Lycium barbarum TaxID=112863 RepID=UPI00293F5510|nr:uncharacterized protein LOC132644534 [Lycium barbarum]
MAKKTSRVTFVICIFLLIVNLCFASEKTDSSSNDESATTHANDKGLDWYHPWFHPHPPIPAHGFPHRPWPFVHPPMPAGGFHRYPWLHPHPWPFVHPPMPAGGFHPHPWIHPRPWPFIHPRFPYPWAHHHPWPFMHPPVPSPPKGDNGGKN